MEHPAESATTPTAGIIPSPFDEATPFHSVDRPGVLLPGCPFAQLGPMAPVRSMKRRWLSLSWARWRVTVRRLTVVPVASSSNAIRDAGHLWWRRIVSIRAITGSGVAVGWRRGADERSSRPASPKRRQRFTHFEAHWREILIPRPHERSDGSGSALRDGGDVQATTGHYGGTQDGSFGSADG